MKNYEEMAQSVLKRRDIEVKRRKRAFLIGAPCAAAVLAAAAGVGTVVASQSRGKYINPVVDFPPGAAEVNSSAEIGEAVSSADIAVAPAEPIDFTNPNVGQTNIHVVYAEDLHMDNGADVDGYDFNEYTLDEMDNFYGLRFNRLGDLYPEWELSHGKIGAYSRTYSETKAGVDVMVHEYGPDRNTLNYTTENGGKVSVTVQRDKFEPLSPEFAVPEKNTSTSIPAPEIHTEYDENGNVIGQTAAGYNPAAGRGPDPNAQPPERVNCYPAEISSVINGYDAIVCGQLTKGEASDIDFFAADIDMASHVRIIAKGLSEKEFTDILDNFTNNAEAPLKTDPDAPAEPTGYVNPNVGQNDIKVLDLDEFNIKEKSIDLGNGTFYEYTFEELDKIYNLHFNILGELHPDWNLSHDKLGMYNIEYFGKKGYHIEIHDPDNFSDCNTLNYVTGSGAAVSVSAQPEKFEPLSDEIFTDDKPDDPSKYTTETAYDDDGKPIGFLSKPIDPDNWRPDTDEGVSTVNGYEALIYRNADGNFLADLNMVYSRVRITADGMSEEEFLMILDEFTKI